MRPITSELTWPQIQKDILAICLLHVRTSSLFTSDDRAWSQYKKSAEEGATFDPDLEPADYGLAYTDVAASNFAAALEQQFELAVSGVVVDGVEALDYESIHMWVAAHLMDLASSQVVEEWESYGVVLREPIQRCLHVSELANARLALEEEELFSYFAARRDATEEGGLTIRQVALLAGMEEMSVRTAASRAGPHQLITQKRDGRTIVTTHNAKEWLRQKGKYVPITRRRHGVKLDLLRSRFQSLDELSRALHAHERWIKTTQGATLRSAEAAEPIVLTREGVEDAELIASVAARLDLDPKQLTLRVRQAALSSELHAVETRLAALAR